MSEIIPTKPDGTAYDVNHEDTALLKALNRLLVPLARLCLANGITFATADEFLKLAFVQEAGALQPGAPEHGKVSRISTATGINRREVTRLTKIKTPERAVKQPLAAEILARWTTDHSYRKMDGTPRVLSRLGAAPSFEALAHEITRDVHPRSMLDELIRLGLASHDETRDVISITRNDFVPRSDIQQMLSFLSDNVGDHLDAAVANVLLDSSRHHEQAVFADELSAESVAELRPLIAAVWQALRERMVPAITKLIEADKRAGRVQDQRVRIGLYSFSDATTDADTSQKDNVPRRFRKSLQKDNAHGI
jgi:hypothetical protein